MEISPCWAHLIGSFKISPSDAVGMVVPWFAIDLLILGENGLLPAELGISRTEIVQALVVA